MTTTPFEIKVVFDATQRKRRGAVVRSSTVTAASGTSWLAVGAMFNLVVAAAMYYVTWWNADPFIYMTFMTKTPVDMPAEFAANPFGLKTLPDPSPGPESIPDPQPETNGELSMQSRWSGKTAQAVIGASAYSWLVLATAGACAVAMAGGAWLGTMGGHWVRVSGFLGMVALALGAGYFGYRVWAEYEMMYKPAQLRIGMGLLTLVVALLGLSLAEGARGITKLAGITVIVAALSTSVGTWLWAQCGALDLKYAAWSMLAAAFGIHALWGVVLLVAAPRIRI